MNKEEYNTLVKKITPKEHTLKNCFIAFIVGGFIGIFGTLIHEVLTKTFGVSMDDAAIWVIVILIGLSSLFTGLGFFDDWFSKTKAGLLIPITGFAHSMTSSALDYKKEGLITGIGANTFKLAGSVILYGVISAFLFTVIKVVFFL